MIYIGKRKYKFGRMFLSHMIADSVEELFAFCKVLEIDIKHFQVKPGMPHFDICQAKKKIALSLGKNVKEVDDREIIRICKELYGSKRKSYHVDIARDVNKIIDQL